MSVKGSRQLTILFTCGPDAVEEGETVFANHSEWMERTHFRDGPRALLSYNVSRGPELENPLDPRSGSTGQTTFVLTEVYARRVGLEDHWRRALTTWEGFDAFSRWARKCRITTLHGAEIIQSLW